MISERFLRKYRHAINPEGQLLVHNFFITFSRFECALKTTITYATVNKNKVEPNWDKFISDIKKDFDKTKSPELKSAVDFLLVNPPKIQSLEKNTLTWIDRVFPDNTPVIFKLSQHIRDIRNNLFHGGKFNGVYQQDISRNYKLINSALIVINELVVLNDSVCNDFLSDIKE